MDNDDTNDPTEWGLVYPFVVCTTKGGPYDDQAFVAGVRFGSWRELLKLQPTMNSNWEPAGLVPQFELLAMEHHYTMTTKPMEGDPFWVEVTMTLGVNDDNDSSERQEG